MIINCRIALYSTVGFTEKVPCKPRLENGEQVCSRRQREQSLQEQAVGDLSVKKKSSPVKQAQSEGEYR